MKRVLALVVLALVALAPAVAEEKPVTVAYYYRVRWGFQQEFERLFFKNHYPVLKEQMGEGGRIKAVNVYRPTFHGEGRADWTFLVVIHVLELERPRRPEPGRGDREAPLPGPGHLPEGRAAPLRDPRRPLGRPAERGRAAPLTDTLAEPRY